MVLNTVPPWPYPCHWFSCVFMKEPRIQEFLALKLSETLWLVVSEMIWCGFLNGPSFLFLTYAAIPDIRHLSHVGNEKVDHNIWAIVQTALFPDTVSYSQIKHEDLIWQFCEILMNVQR